MHSVIYRFQLEQHRTRSPQDTHTYIRVCTCNEHTPPLSLPATWATRLISHLRVQQILRPERKQGFTAEFK